MENIISIESIKNIEKQFEKIDINENNSIFIKNNNKILFHCSASYVKILNLDKLNNIDLNILLNTKKSDKDKKIYSFVYKLKFKNEEELILIILEKEILEDEDFNFYFYKDKIDYDLEEFLYKEIDNLKEVIISDNLKFKFIKEFYVKYFL